VKVSARFDWHELFVGVRISRGLSWTSWQDAIAQRVETRVELLLVPALVVRFAWARVERRANRFVS
jgi:hypothetical protein